MVYDIPFANYENLSLISSYCNTRDSFDSFRKNNVKSVVDEIQAELNFLSASKQAMEAELVKIQNLGNSDIHNVHHEQEESLEFNNRLPMTSPRIMVLEHRNDTDGIMSCEKLQLFMKEFGYFDSITVQTMQNRLNLYADYEAYLKFHHVNLEIQDLRVKPLVRVESQYDQHSLSQVRDSMRLLYFQSLCLFGSQRLLAAMVPTSKVNLENTVPLGFDAGKSIDDVHRFTREERVRIELRMTGLLPLALNENKISNCIADRQDDPIAIEIRKLIVEGDALIKKNNRLLAALRRNVMKNLDV